MKSSVNNLHDSEWVVSNSGLDILRRDYVELCSAQYKTPKIKAKAIAEAIFHFNIMTTSSVYSRDIYLVLVHAKQHASDSIKEYFNDNQD